MAEAGSLRSDLEGSAVTGAGLSFGGMSPWDGEGETPGLMALPPERQV